MPDETVIPLPHTSTGAGNPPIVLLHGFGGDRRAWDLIAGPLGSYREVLAFDLPGHGKAARWTPIPDVPAAAKAVLQSLDAMNVAKASFVGHSMGGAVAALVGIFAPERLEHLVLLAPGGFAPDVNVPLLKRYAAATDQQALQEILVGFCGPSSTVPGALAEAIAEARQDNTVRDAHAAIVHRITEGDGQGTLPLKVLAAAPFPTTLIWGEEDAITPLRHALDAPAPFARHILKGKGHMLPQEAPEAVVRTVKEALEL
ncbi:MAG: alpha/beta fold hydrolase [Pseudomonadota bacterium]